MYKLKVYLELIRPFTLIAPIIGFLSGSVIACGTLPNLSALIGALSAAMLNAASNVNNQYFDLDIDKVNKPFRPFPSAKVSKKGMIFFTLFLYCSAIVPTLFINPQLFTIILITAIISFYYSSPPFRIKKYPFLSNIFIAIPRGMLLIVAGWSVYKSVTDIMPWFVGLIFALYLVGAASTKDFSDIVGDRQFGIRTLPIKYGAEKATKIISPFFYLPFLLIPFGVFINVLKSTTLPLTLLMLWGFYTANLIIKNPQGLALEKNHISWIHMYLILIIGQLGFAVAYIIRI